DDQCRRQRAAARGAGAGWGRRPAAPVGRRRRAGGHPPGRRGVEKKVPLPERWLRGFAPVPALVATPTAANGQLDPAVLLGRLERSVAEGWQPWEYDLQQALLRLPRGSDPGLAARARRLGTPVGGGLGEGLATRGRAGPAGAG